MKKTLAALILSLTAPLASAIDCTGMGSWLNQACSHVSDVAQNGKSDIYISGYTWHDPSTYTPDKLAELNKWGWGAGYGKHVVDENGNEDLVLGMIFSDSHKNPEFLTTYAGLWYTKPLGGLSLGAGYAVGLTSRRDIFGGIPFPIVAPVAALRFDQLSLMATFIPKLGGGFNHGNVAFFFSRYEFE